MRGDVKPGWSRKTLQFSKGVMRQFCFTFEGALSFMSVTDLGCKTTLFIDESRSMFCRLNWFSVRTAICNPIAMVLCSKSIFALLFTKKSLPMMN